MLGVSGKRGNEPAFNLFKQMSGSKPQAKGPILERKLFSRAFQSQVRSPNKNQNLNFLKRPQNKLFELSILVLLPTRVCAIRDLEVYVFNHPFYS